MLQPDMRGPELRAFVGNLQKRDCIRADETADTTERVGDCGVDLGRR